MIICIDHSKGRSWIREFGPSSEWGKKGLFQIITMEQFAKWLVDINM